MAGPPDAIFPGIPLIGGIGSILPIPQISQIGAADGFRILNWPTSVQILFAQGPASWPAAVAEAIRQGIRDGDGLANLIFFMQHPQRMAGGVGTLIDKSEEAFYELRAEWNLCRTIAEGVLNPADKPNLYVPEEASSDYEKYLAKPTTGTVTLFVNGRSQGVYSPPERMEAFDRMQETVESLGPGDRLFIANWQFDPMGVKLTLGRPGLTNWADLLLKKAKEGVTIRVIVCHIPELVKIWRSDYMAIDLMIGTLPPDKLDNFKYIASRHPATYDIPLLSRILGETYIGTHHQKVMIARKKNSLTAYCGGLDISHGRTREWWSDDFVWHDIETKLEGLITYDLEREFVLRWNREKGKPINTPVNGWNPFEDLKQSPVYRGDKARAKNPHKLQMLRTVSVGSKRADVRRDDVWEGYFRLVGRARRFLYLENQYFYVPRLADAIVLQVQAHPDLVVIVVLSSGSDDKPTPFYTPHCLAARHDFFAHLSAGVASNRLGVYTLAYKSGLVHSKLILADDEALCIGSANGDGLSFFIDTELNLMLEDPETVTEFRQRLWSHNLGALPTEVQRWKVNEFVAKWDAVARRNNDKLATSSKLVGEGVIRFDPTKIQGHHLDTVPDVVC